MTHDEMIAVIRAHEEGKEIQFRQSGSDNIWEDCDPHWAFHCIEYRVRPEAREFYITVKENNTVCAASHVKSHVTKFGRPVIKVREVLEGEDE
jgi:hypothetical protein